MAIRICLDPHCEAVMHNCTPANTRCPDCGTLAVTIDYATYFKKYRNHFFQYDMTTGNYLRLEKHPENQQTALAL